MFQAPKLTDAGKNLYYRNMAGEGIKFTTIQLGNGTISGPTLRYDGPCQRRGDY